MMMPLMRRKVNSTQNDEASHIIRRLLNALPSARLELDTFLRLAGVVVTRDISTAAVECLHYPRLLINPDFVDKYCERDEHLFLLVMHEMWHVLLAHTSLYPQMTEAHNIAFDAIINANLLRHFKGPEYLGFFEKVNPPDKFPHLLLRPPVGWPDDPQYPDIGPEGTKRILQQLYPPPNKPSNTTFYQEVLDLILKHAMEHGAVRPYLLGDHQSSRAMKDLMSNEMFKRTIGDIVEGWPESPLYGRGNGNHINEWVAKFGPSSENLRHAFSAILRRYLGPNRGRRAYHHRASVFDVSGKGVLPNAYDRLAPARQLLGMDTTLWIQKSNVTVRAPYMPKQAHLYLDVSGSMSDVMPYLLRLILPYVVNGRVDVFQFSTVVKHLPFAQLRRGLLTTTGGTDIHCVLEHLLSLSKPVQRALIITDGYVGVAEEKLIKAIKARHIRIHVVLPSESPFMDDLDEVAESFTVLPPLERS